MLGRLFKQYHFSNCLYWCFLVKITSTFDSIEKFFYFILSRVLAANNPFMGILKRIYNYLYLKVKWYNLGLSYWENEAMVMKYI